MNEYTHATVRARERVNSFEWLPVFEVLSSLNYYASQCAEVVYGMYITLLVSIRVFILFECILVIKK